MPMTDLNRLFAHRLSRHIGFLLKYLRLVFTDHFVIALFFFCGALGYAYQNGLKTLTNGVWWGPALTVLILTLTSQLGRLATLIEPADTVFLLPAETTMHVYLRHARNYSLLMGTIIQVVVWMVLLPFLAQGDQLSFTAALLVLISQLLVKLSVINGRLRQAMLQTRQGRLQQLLWSWGVPVVTFSVALWVAPWLGVVLAVLSASWSQYQLGRSWQDGQLAWHQLVNDEAARMMTLYRFFNLFTDVPQLASQVHRRRYLDPVWRFMSGSSRNPYRLLFTRGLGRDGDAFGLVIRLTVIGMLLLVFIHNQALSLLIMLLAVYLIGFQLLPFYRQYEGNVFTHLYPISVQRRLQAFRYVLTVILTGMALALLVVDVAVNWSWQRLGVDILALALELVIFIGWYSQLRLKKMSS